MVSAASREAFKRTLWWVPVLFAFNDCFATVQWVQGRPVQSATTADGEEGDVVLVERLSPRLYKFRRGDVVMLRSPEEPRAMLAKRLIGVEGDWIAIPGETRIEKIPKGRCWVEGDYDGRSEDSRTKFGAVPLALIQGSVVRVVWPPSRWGPVDSRLPPGRVIAMGSFSAAALEDEEW